MAQILDPLLGPSKSNTTNQQTLPSPLPLSFYFTGDGLSFALILFKNILLTLVTLGIYMPWAKVEVRKYMMSQTSLDGSSFSFHGTGLELFVGYLKMIGIVLLIYLSGFMLSQFHVVFSVVPALMWPTIIAVAILAGVNFRLSRTEWRGHRFNLNRNADFLPDYTMMWFKGVGFSILTFGIYLPWFKNHLREFLTNRTRYCNNEFKYDGDADEYAILFYKGMILTLLTLGVYHFWFRRDLIRFLAHHTQFKGVRFGSNITAKQIFQLDVGCLLVFCLTVGLATPWLRIWKQKVLIGNLYLSESVDFSFTEVVKPTKNSATGDVLVNEFQIDLGI